jgi:hypothetical protein
MTSNEDYLINSMSARSIFVSQKSQDTTKHTDIRILSNIHEDFNDNNWQMQERRKLLPDNLYFHFMQ